MPRCTQEIDLLLRRPYYSLDEDRRIREDDEWCRVLSADLPQHQVPAYVFADLLGALGQQPNHAMYPEEGGRQRLVDSREQVRVWFGRALAGHAQITLTAYDCWHLFRLINAAIEAVDAAPAAPSPARVYDPVEGWLDPPTAAGELASWRVAS